MPQLDFEPSYILLSVQTVLENRAHNQPTTPTVTLPRVWTPPASHTLNHGHRLLSPIDVLYPHPHENLHAEASCQESQLSPSVWGSSLPPPVHPAPFSHLHATFPALCSTQVRLFFPHTHAPPCPFRAKSLVPQHQVLQQTVTNR